MVFVQHGNSLYLYMHLIIPVIIWEDTNNWKQEISIKVKSYPKTENPVQTRHSKVLLIPPFCHMHDLNQTEANSSIQRFLIFRYAAFCLKKQKMIINVFSKLIQFTAYKPFYYLKTEPSFYSNDKNSKSYHIALNVPIV